MGFSGFFRHFNVTWVLVCGLVAGCGGGGSVSPAIETRGLAVTLSSTTISGVVSTGAPIMGGFLRIKDATGADVPLRDFAGQVVHEAKTSVADGSYQLDLASATQYLPLMLQVSGVDAAGAPVLLHSALSNTSAPSRAHVSPVTDAVLALVLGINPKEAWVAPAAHAGSILKLGNPTVMGAAADLMKTVLAANLSGAKITDTKTLDFFRSDSFLANKTGLDLALEGLRIQTGKDAAGLDQLQLSSKFASRVAPEVRINLVKAREEILKSTGGIPTNAIVSTLKATSALAIGKSDLGTLDTLTAEINRLISQAASAEAFGASTALATYVGHEGRTKAQLLDLLAGYAQSNWQLGPLLVTGCADDPLPSGGCTRVAVSTLVSDPNGVIKDVFSDVVTYKAATKTVPGQWAVTGNGATTQFRVLPAAYAEFAGDRLLTPTSTEPNPRSGVLVELRSAGWGAQLLPRVVGEGQVQMPGNFSARLMDCSQIQPYLCLTPTAVTTVLPVPFAGGPKDRLIGPSYPGWAGSVNGVAGAKYTASYVLAGTATPVHTLNAYLHADVPASPSSAQFPRLDAEPTLALIQSGAALSWAQWARDNPNMKIKGIQLVDLSDPDVPLVKTTEIPPYLTGMTSWSLAGQVTASGIVTYQLLLTAQDNLGRLFYSLIHVVN